MGDEPLYFKKGYQVNMISEKIRCFVAKGKRAFTLTELAIVLGAAGIVLGAIWAGASTVWNRYELGKAIQQVTTTAQNIRDYYDPRGDIPSTFNTGIPEAVKWLPSEISASGNKHALGGTFSVGRIATPLGFYITLSGLSLANCIQAIMQFPIHNDEIGVGFIGSSPAKGTIVDRTTPLDTTTVTSWCTNVSSLYVKFLLRN